jgi:hypothetical protein
MSLNPDGAWQLAWHAQARFHFASARGQLELGVAAGGPGPRLPAPAALAPGPAAITEVSICDMICLRSLLRLVLPFNGPVRFITHPNFEV